MTLNSAFHAATGQDPEGFKEVLVINDELRSAKVYYNIEAREMVIGFDCTQGTPWPPSLDWLQNLKAWPVASSPKSMKYKAMAGFVAEYLALREGIINQVFIFQPKTIHVAGFSQGAAHATLCHRDLVANFRGLEIHTVAFASPRVYQRIAAEEFDRELAIGGHGHTFERVQLWGDPVPSLPPWFLGYSHVGKARRIGSFTIVPRPERHGGDPYLKFLEGL